MYKLCWTRKFCIFGSIYENIHMYTENVDYEWLDKCIKYVGLDQLINSLDKGGEVMIGEGYRKLIGVRCKS